MDGAGNHSRLKRGLPWLLLKLAVTVIGFTLLRRTGVFSNAAVLKMVSSPAAVAAMVGVAVIYDLIRGFSLFWVLHQTGRRASFWNCVKAQFIGHFFNFFVPGQAGGIGAKSIYLARLLRLPWKSAINVLTVELLMGFLALTAFTSLTVALLAMRSSDAELATRSWLYALVSAALTLLVPLLLRGARRYGWIGSPEKDDTGWRGELKRAAGWLDRWPLCLQIGGLAFLTYLMKCLVLLIAARQLGAPPEVDYAAICSGFSLGVIASIVPIAPGGLITGNIGFGSALALLTGAPFALGADIYTALWAVHALLGVFGGLIFALSPARTSQER